MNVGIVTPRYPPTTIGGGEISVQLLAGQLRGHDAVDAVTVYSFDDAPGRERDKNGTRVVRLGTLPRTMELSNLYAYRKLTTRVTDHDLLHGYNMALHPTVGALSTRHGIPSVATLNSYSFLPEPVPGLDFTTTQRVRSKTTDRIARYFLNGVDAFVGLSQAIIDIYRSHGFSENEFVHVPNMLDPDFVGGAQSTSRGDGTRLIYVGNLLESKGVAYLIRAMTELPDEFTLRVVGTGPQEDTLKELCRNLSLEHRVEFSGSIPYEEVPSAYRQADVFVHPGVWPEPFPRTMLEAMQSGLPVVCTDIGAPPEVVPDESVVATTRDSHSLAEAIRSASGRTGELGEQNRQFVADNYTPARVLPQMIDLYQSLVTGRQSTSRQDGE